MKQKYFLSGIFLFLIAQLSAQPASDSLLYPRMGQPCPDFVLRNIKYFNKKEATLKDFAGKWLILDFWNKRCAACIASFPKVNQLKKQFEGRVQYMLVGIQDKEKQIESIYARLKEKEQLEMPCSFDSLLAQQWDIYAGPDVLLIDPEGIVRAHVAAGLHADEIEGFLSGNPPALLDYNKQYDLTPFDNTKLFLVNGNGGKEDNFLFRSLLSKWDGTTQHLSYPGSLMADSANGRFQILGPPLFILFNFAYYGQKFPGEGYLPYPVIATKDSFLFKYSLSSNDRKYCYSLQVPPKLATKEKMMHIMQRDLENYFGLTANIEERTYPTANLVATEKAKKNLKTKGGTKGVTQLFKAGDLTARNIPVADLVNILSGSLGMDISDKTGITGNIDITLHCLFTIADDIKKALKENGLELLPGDGETKKVLVIKDMH